ncbi:hypothetical protein NT6N_20700 [Oceaniferula spumae]|uniref:Ice-binding protein C-terminal domain-containing protein n=1 Tax=Oceaniferula spumae TaxID=2979115 RepID=A0AAT9FLY7_9BACT
MNSKLLTRLILPTLIQGTSIAASVSYSVETNIGPSGTLFSDAGNRDNWTGSDIGNWRAQSQSGLIYLRNHNGGDDIITRTNDSNFSFTIGPAVTSFSILIDARIDTFWEAGINASGGGPQLLIGGDFNDSNNFFINFNGTRYNSDAGLANVGTNGGNIATLRLDYDVINGTADLVYDPSGANQVLVNDAALNITATQIQNMDQLYARAGNQFAGAGNWTITTVPEPSSAALLGLGGLGLLLRRRK